MGNQHPSYLFLKEVEGSTTIESTLNSGSE